MDPLHPLKLPPLPSVLKSNKLTFPFFPIRVTGLNERRENVCQLSSQHFAMPLSVSSTQAGSNPSSRSKQQNPPSAAAEAGCTVVQSWVIKCPTSYLHKIPRDWCMPRVTQLISTALSHMVSAQWCYTDPTRLLTVPNTTSTLAARTKSLLQDLPQVLDFAGSLWGGGSQPLPHCKESPCSKAQGELQVVPGFGKTFANQNYYFPIIFCYYFPNSTSQGWYHATHNQCVSVTHYLHLPFSRCSLIQEISKASRSKRGGWLCTKCILSREKWF